MKHARFWSTYFHLVQMIRETQAIHYLNTHMDWLLQNSTSYQQEMKIKQELQQEIQLGMLLHDGGC